MKVVMVTSSYPPAQGGVETHVSAISEKLVGLGHEVTVLVRYGDRPSQLKVGAVMTYRLPKTRLKWRWWMLAQKQLIEKTDVVHSHDLWLSGLKQHFSTKKFVHTFHGYEGFPVADEAIAVRRQINQAADATVAVGAFIEKWYGTKVDLITYGGIEPVDIHQPAINWDFIYYGRFEPDTGIDQYLAVFELVIQKTPRAKVLIVGSGTLEAKVKDLAAKFPKNVELRPTQPHDSIIELLQQSRIAAVSGYLAILEAAYFGKMIMANYNSPIKKDYLECHPLAKQMAIGQTGADMVAKLEQLFPQSSQITAANQAWAKQQTWGHLAQQYLKLYQGKS